LDISSLHSLVTFEHALQTTIHNLVPYFTILFWYPVLADYNNFSCESVKYRNNNKKKKKQHDIQLRFDQSEN